MKIPTRPADGKKLKMGFWLCTIDVQLDDLSERWGVPIDSWEEPGLGEARGLVCQLPSGSIVSFEEFLLAREHLGADLMISVEATELVRNGISQTLNKTLAELSLPRSVVTWVTTEDNFLSARSLVLADKAAPTDL